MDFDYQLEQSIIKICTSQYNYFLKKKNVVGVALGYKVTRGFRTCQKCIQVFVSKKMYNYELLNYDRIPVKFNGLFTDVVETGIFTTCSLRTKIRPFFGGYSIGAMESEINGTAGCLVSNGVLQFMLSTNHNLANNNIFPLGKPIVQPSYDYGGKSSQDIIGTLYKYSPLYFIEGETEPINLTDAAIGLLKIPNVLSPEIAYMGKITCVKNAKLNDDVQKVGSTTELTQGIVTSISGTIIVNYPESRRVLFKDIIITTRMSSQGDSGSILLNNSNCALGMLFSQGPNNSTYCNLKTVLDQLDVHIVN